MFHHLRILLNPDYHKTITPSTSPSLLREGLGVSSKLIYTTHKEILRNLNELAITETELKLMAAAAIIGDNKMPKNGYKIPAAIGMPKTL